jgi:hypothetical protein
MANNPQWYDGAINGALAALGSGATLKIYQGTQPALDAAISGATLLVTLTFSSTAFGSSASGVATANAITGANAVATGTAQFFALATSGGTIIMTGTVGTSGCDLNVSSTAVVNGAPVTCSSFTVTG